MAEKEQDYIVQDDELYGKPIKPIPRPEPKIGIDTNDTFLLELANAVDNNVVDMSAIEKFSSLAKDRDRIYSSIDTMCEDSTIAAVLETYIEDATEYNDEGKIIWVESADQDVLRTVTEMLDSMNVNKNIYRWMACLCKYGDVYLRLFRKSQYDKVFETSKDKDTLNEAIYAVAYRADDKYATYVEMMPNPAEMFELTAWGKSVGFIKADVSTLQKKDAGFSLPYYSYTFSDNDIIIYPPTEFVHAYLEDTSSRVPETVEIVQHTEDDGKETADAVTKGKYSVRRGQSLFANAYRAWRNLTLLENSMLLNRITKSSIIRIIEVETGSRDPKEIPMYLRRIKTLFEQKMAINTGDAMNEYNNPGPIENTVYIPKHGEVGTISVSNVGGDIDVKNIADVEYYRDKMFGALKVPKHFFSNTDDGAGFNGGTSLSLISSRYAKTIKRLQNTMVQMVTTLIKLLLLDRELDSYVNKFTIKMLPPTTQEELDRQENLSKRLEFISSTMNVLSDIDNPTDRLKIVKSMLANVISDQDVIKVIEDVIAKKEQEDEEQSTPYDDETDFGRSEPSFRPSSPRSDRGFEDREISMPDETDFSSAIEDEIGGGEEELAGVTELPDMSGMGVDFTDNTNF